jgi:hypothetical protein
MFAKVPSIRFEFTKAETWPQLAWVAFCNASSEVIEVFHGSRVETSADWFGEIIWDGEYAAAGFDLTDIVSGTGARLRNGVVDFVSAGSTVDRLVVLERLPDEVWVSNSLPALLSKCSVSLRASHPAYISEILSVVKGIRKCTRYLTTTSEPVELVYFDNYRWDGCKGMRIEKPFPRRDFGTFDQYEGFLRTCLERLSRNLHDTRRIHPFSLITTISSGYDSPTIATLARDYGCRLALTFAQSREGADDSGIDIGRRLGLETKCVASSAWRKRPHCEAPFYGSAGVIGEIVYTGLADYLPGSVLLTGYHGDAVWGLRTKYSGRDIVRSDCSGLALTEYRLNCGFIHCPVPFFGVRQIDDIHRMACQVEMAPWTLAGTDYNRPVCRRIVEGAGIPRELFGVDKKAVGLSRFYLSPESRASYMSFLQEHQREWIAERRIPPIRSKLFDDFVDIARRCAYHAGLAVVQRTWRKKAAKDTAPASHNAEGLRGSSLVTHVQEWLLQPRNLHRYIVPWAIEECKRDYIWSESSSSN